MATEQALHAKLTMTFRGTRRFGIELPGSGGWGDPLDRELALVAHDLRGGLVTHREGAARDYGVVASGDPPVIDERATIELRATAARGSATGALASRAEAAA